MPAPTLISYTEVTSGFTAAGGSRSCASISWQTNDVVTVLAGAEGAGGTDEFGTPTATGLTFAKNKNNFLSGTCKGFTATAVAGSSSSGAVTVTNANTTEHWGFAVWVHRLSLGVGNSAEQHTTTATVNLTPTGANGAMVYAIFDFSVGALQTITPTPTNQRQRAQDATHYSYYVADLADQTSAGAVAYGLAAGTGGLLTILVQEIKAAAAAAATLEQEGYRFRNDDGSETTATWKAAQDTNITAATGLTVRSRLLINATNDPASAQYKLQYRKQSGPGPWRNVDKFI